MPLNTVWVPDELTERVWGKKMAHQDSVGRRGSWTSVVSDSSQGTPNTQALAPKPSASWKAFMHAKKPQKDLESVNLGMADLG